MVVDLHTLDTAWMHHVYEDDVVFLGSFDGSEYFQVNQFVGWEDANQIAMNFAPI